MASSALGIPLRKRTRKACDQCRRRKTKCQGDLDCSTCIEVGIKCTYGHSVKQRRGLKYVAYLEEKVEDLERRVGEGPASSKTTDDEGISAKSSKTTTTSSFDPAPALFDPPVTTTPCEDTETQLILQSSPALPANSDVLETINCAPQRAFGNTAAAHYRGNSSGIEILRHLHSLCYGCVLLTTDQQEISAANLMNALDRSFPLHYLSLNSMTNAFLPSFAKLSYWTETAFCSAFNLWPFIDRQLFRFNVKRLFEQQSFGGDTADRDHLGLIYAVLALGQRYDPENDPMDDSVESGNMRGLNYFAAALDLVPLADCNRSITAVQTVLCMALYLKSISAQGMMHTYVSTAACAAHQLGLHVASHHLAARERAIRHRVYTALKILDTYVTISLGLPRNVRAAGPLCETLDAPYIDCREMLIAADAFAELLEILGAAVEAIYFTGDSSTIHGPHIVRYGCFDKVDKSLADWELKFIAHAQPDEDIVPLRTSLRLLLEYSKCFVLLMLYSPFTHHYVWSRDNRNTHASTCGLKCVEAAIQAVGIADALNGRGLLIEAYPLTVDVLIIAATTLLAVGLAAPDDNIVTAANKASKAAKALLEQLSARNTAVARCLASLTPLYNSLPERSLTSQAMTAMQDFTLFTRCGDDSIPNSELDSSNLGLFAANNLQNTLATPSYVSAEPDWPSDNCFAPNRSLCY